MPYFVYILRTSSNTLYIGQTNNLEKRLKEHQTKNSKSAKYTRYFSSLELVYSETFASRKEAVHREVELKKWPRSQKDGLIKDQFPITLPFDNVGPLSQMVIIFCQATQNALNGVIISIPSRLTHQPLETHPTGDT